MTKRLQLHRTNRSEIAGILVEKQGDDCALARRNAIRNHIFAITIKRLKERNGKIHMKSERDGKINMK